MGRAGDGVFKGIQFRGEDPGDAVIDTARGGHGDGQAVEKLQLLRVRGHSSDGFFGIKYRKKVPAEICFPGTGTEGGFHGVCDRDRRERVGGEVQFIATFVTGGTEFSALGVEIQRVPGCLVSGEENERRGKGGVAAKVNLPGGGEPAELIPRPTGDGESGLRQSVLRRDLPHQRVRNPRVQDADGGGVPVEQFCGESVCDILLHGGPPSVWWVYYRAARGAMQIVFGNFLAGRVSKE